MLIISPILISILPIHPLQSEASIQNEIYLSKTKKMARQNNVDEYDGLSYKVEDEIRNDNSFTLYYSNHRFCLVLYYRIISFDIIIMGFLLPDLEHLWCEFLYRLGYVIVLSFYWCRGKRRILSFIVGFLFCLTWYRRIYKEQMMYFLYCP